MGPDYNVYAYSPDEWGVRRGFLQGLWPRTVPALAVQISFLAVPLLFSAVLVIQGIRLEAGEHLLNAGIEARPKPHFRRAERSLFYATGRDRTRIHAYTPSEWGATHGRPRDWRAVTTAFTVLLLGPGLLSPAIMALGFGPFNPTVIVFGAVATAVFSPALAGVYNASVREYGTAALRRLKGLPSPKFLVGDADAADRLTGSHNLDLLLQRAQGHSPAQAERQDHRTAHPTQLPPRLSPLDPFGECRRRALRA